MRSTVVTLLAGVALAACAPKAAPPAAPDPAAVKASIEAANAKFIAAMQAGDTVTAAANYTDDAIVMNPNSTASHGRAAIMSALAGMLAMGKLTEFVATTDAVMVDGDIAVETGRGVMTMTPTKGKPMQDKVKYLTVWKKQADGSWKIVRDINNSDLPPAK